MRIDIKPITLSDLSSAIHCIQVAFASDPYFLWVYDSQTFNKIRNHASLTAKCLWGINSSHALFYVAKDTDDPTGRVLGVSMWTTPASTRAGASNTQSWSDWTNDWLLWVRQGVNVAWYRGWGGLKKDRYWIWKREQAVCQDEIFYSDTASHAKLGREGFYFVNIVTVLPEAQGKGIGKRLFEVVMERADREAKACYLESSRWEPNVEIYRRLGFEVAKKMRCVSEDGKEGGCDLFCMVREPKLK